jgi:hypothetical protein
MWYSQGMETKHKTSFTLTATAKALLSQLAEAQGISQAAVLELLIRQAAREQLPGHERTRS